MKAPLSFGPADGHNPIPRSLTVDDVDMFTQRILMVMAESLENASTPPKGSMRPSDYIRNEAFQTMAKALRDEAERESERRTQ